ncbi:aldehyde dehydrogenase family protein [Paenibacillus thalictri]|uniref:3-sulfolactaldehyde dehydrogenase n=2 Tax=Paenibacillus thalictri TaxID=2527873 RepID=A0A4V2J3X4_9BACL|nr:aldehyde dehydrogenase family protein [Paenibacillus thalictri]
MDTGNPLVQGSIIDGKEVRGGSRMEVRSPYNQHLIGYIETASPDDVNEAVASAHRVFHDVMKSMPAYRRADILRKTADLVEQSADEFVRLLALEAGKPLREGRAEVARGVQVLRFAAEGAKNIGGEQIPLDSAIGGEGRWGLTKRYPLGVVAAITPFNFPLNLVLHKVAPALAAGNTVVLKPAEKTPFTPVLLYKLLEQAGLPQGALQILMGPGTDIVEPLVTDPRVKKVTFTGSSAVGWRIKEMAKSSKVTLELGSNAPNLIFDDADLDAAAASIVKGGFVYAGQACVSVQRVYVQQNAYQPLLDKLLAEVGKLKVGDPEDPATDVGPMITGVAAERAESWVREAVAQGARAVAGGKRNGTLFEPTVLVDVRHEMKVVCQEVFAPIVCLLPFQTEAEAVAYANDSEFGLQAGVFTSDLNRALRIADVLETGGVWINEVSLLRYDHIPYGGVKRSGIGKEGVKYAIEDMTELKFIGIRLL